MVSFADLKRNRGNQFENLKDSVTKKSNFVNHDAKCWKPTLDKAGNGYAIIRFLPAPVFLSDDEVDYTKVECFNFKYNNKYYIENSLKTLGKPDPADKLKWELWNKGDAESKAMSKVLKNRTVYYANIYVVKDMNAPQNEGKVFPYKFGAQVFGKIQNALTPEFPDEVPFNPFDLWEGKALILKIKTGDNDLPDYGNSNFELQASPLFDDDAKMESVWKQCESVSAWRGDDRFKSYEDLEKRLKLVLGLTDEPEGNEEPAPSRTSAKRPEPQREEPKPKAESKPAPKEDASLDDDDEFLRQFQGLND